MKKKIFATSLLAVIAALCLTFVFTGTGRSVNADTALKNKDIVMEEGAAIRTKEPMGIRFTAKIKKSVKNSAKEFGMYVCPADLLGENGMFPVRKSVLKAGLIEGEAATSDKFIQKVKVEKDYVIEGTGKYDTFKVALVGIQNKNIDREFSAVAYVVDDKGNEIFSDTVVTRCISDVAKEALEDPESGLGSNPTAKTYLENIKADSNDIVLRGADGLGTTDVTHQNGIFCHTITVAGSKTCTFRLRKKFRNSLFAGVTVDAKASGENMQIDGQDVATENFVSIPLGRSRVRNNRVTFEVAGNGTLYIDNIRVTAMNSLGLDGVTLGGSTENTATAKKKALFKTLPNGNTEYNSDVYGYSDIGLDVTAKEIPEDEYFVFRFKYYADMEDPAKTGNDKYFHAGYNGNEGLWFQGKDDKYYATFGEDLTDYTIYNETQGNGPCYGSYHGTFGFTTKPDTWYYAVAPTPGNPELVRHYYPHCHIEISDMYFIPGTLKNEIFIKRNYPGDGFTALEGTDVTDFGLNVLSKPTAESPIELETDMNGYKYYSNCGKQWGDSGIKFTFPAGTDLSDKYVVMKFRYSRDNEWDPSEGLWFAFNYGETPANDPWLQVFDEDGYDYTIYNQNNGNANGTFRRGNYSTKPDTWYYMVNRKGTPQTFTVGTAAVQKYTIGGVYAIESKENKFTSKNYPVLLRMPYESNVLGVGKTLTPDIAGASFGVEKDDLSYESSNPQIASVSAQGVISGVSAGKCDITVSVNGHPDKTGVIKITVTGTDPLKIFEEGCGDIRKFPLTAVKLGEKNQGQIESNLSTLKYKPESGTLEYEGGESSQWGNVKFTTGGTVGADEYLVLKFKYYGDMEEEGTKYFGPDAYSDEGLWIQGYDFESGHAKDYFSVFDEDYYDYTLYMRKDGDTSYEGNDLTVPYGSLHGTKGLTTNPGTWYYAIAPVKGNYQAIGSCNANLHIEIGGIYAVKQNIRSMFVPQHYPLYINLPYGEKEISVGGDAEIAPDIVGSSIKTVTADNLEYLSSDSDVASVDGNGKITGVSQGECTVTVSLKNDAGIKKTVKVTVVPAPLKFEGDGIRRLDLSAVRLAGEGEYAEAAKAQATLEYDASRGRLLYKSGDYCNQSIGFTLGETEENAVGTDDYVVIRFRYFDDMYFDEEKYSVEGLWLRGYGDGQYFATFDEDGYDYTVYSFGNIENNSQFSESTPYGSYHGRDGLTTNSGTWYYAVAPMKGSFGFVSSYNYGVHIEIEGIYAVSETVKNTKFVKGHYPEALSRPAAFEGNGIRRLDLSSVRLGGNQGDTTTAQSKATLGYNSVLHTLLYKSADYCNQSIGFTLGETEANAVGTNDYAVIKFRYFDDMRFLGNKYGDEGLWLRGYGDGQYFATFDEDGYDYTVYSFGKLKDNSQFLDSVPYGSYHGRDGLTTSPGTWYYAVAPVKGSFGFISSYNYGVHIEIEGIYAVSDDVKDQKFEKGKYPDGLRRPAEFKDESNIRALDLPSVRLDGNGEYADAAKSAATLGYNPVLKRLLYKSGDYCNQSIGFTPGGTINDDECLVLKFRYFDDMYFLGNKYGDEGLWLRGYGAGKYMATFDEDYKDYTIYNETNANGPYYGSYHGTNGLTTMPDTWYYAVTPEKGGITFVSSYNHGVHIEIAGIYAVKEAFIGQKFPGKTYPKTLNSPYGGLRLDIGETAALNIRDNSIGLEEGDVICYSSGDESVATVDSSGTVTGVATGECNIEISLSGGGCAEKTVRVMVLKELDSDAGNDDDGIRTFDISEPALDRKLKADGTTQSDPDAVITSDGEMGTFTYKGGTGSAWGEAQFKTCGTVNTGEYLVLKFRYMAEMEDNYFGPDSYSDEGLWIQGWDFGAKGGTSGHAKDYFSIFDENGYDYTLYQRKDGDTSYEGNDLTVPYGSFHRADKITTKPGVWYYAVAPVEGDYQSISSCNKNLYIEVAGIYAVSKAVKEEKFNPKNYPGFIADAATEMSVLIGEARDISNALVLTMPDSNGPVTACSSSDAAIASVTDAGVITGVNEGECNITVRYRNSSKDIKVHVLPVPAQDGETLPAGINSFGTDCIAAGGAGAHAFKAGNMVHYEVFDAKADHGHNAGTVNLNANIGNNAYLVIKAMYTPGMNFIDEENNEGLWILGHRNDAIYNTTDKYDYFSVIGKKNGVYTDYTIYSSDCLPYGSYHNFSKELTTEPNTWYYFIAPQKGNYTNFGSFLVDADMIIGGVYGVSEEYYNAHIVDNLKSGLVYRLETVDSADAGKLTYPVPRKRLYEANTDESNEFRLAAYVPDDRYICFEIEYDESTDFNSLNFVAARGRTYYRFGTFGTDENMTDYGVYKNDDVIQGVCGIQNTEANTSYYLIAPAPGNFDWFALRGDDKNFKVTIKDIRLINEEQRNGYVAIATNNRAASAEPGSEDPVITFGVLADSHLHIPNPDYNPYDPASPQYLGGTSLLYSKEHFETALNYFKNKNVDALLLNGDIIEATVWNKKWDGTDGAAYTLMNQIMDKVWGANRLDAPDHVMYTLGNHEYYYKGVTPDYAWSELEKAGYPRWESFEANGYTFISLDISTQDGTVDGATRHIVEKRLAAANAADPKKPIFVTLHIPPKESVFNCDPPTDSDWINEMLDQYPQIVMFGSHTHYSTRHPLSFNQNRATVVNVGPGTYGCVPTYNFEYNQGAEEKTQYNYDNVLKDMAYAGDVYENGTIDEHGWSTLDYVADYNKLCEGLMVRVYLTGDEANPHRVEIERVNLLNGEKIGPDWKFTATKNRDDFVYTTAKQETRYNNLMPVLSKEGDNKCSVSWNGNDRILFNLKPSNGTEAGMGDNVVDCYKVEILDGSTVLYTKHYISDYWLTNGYGELNGFEMFVKEENRNKALTVKVKALDAYGRASNELIFDIGAPSAS